MTAHSLAPQPRPTIESTPSSVFAAKVSRTDPIMVTLDAYGETHEWGPVTWLGDGVPARGDRCLAFRDDHGQMWAAPDGAALADLAARIASLESDKADISATVLETVDDSAPRALAVYTTNPLSGRKPRFVVENNQDTDEVDIDFRNCTVNFGDPDAAVSTDGAAIFSQPAGGTSSPIQVNKPGSSSWKVFFVAAAGTVNLGVGGLSSVAMRVNAEGEANDRYWLGEYGEARFGPGGATALDTDFKRRQGGIMEVGQIGASGRLQVGFISSEAYVQARDEDASVFRVLNVVGSSINIAPNNTTKLLANPTGLGFFGATPVAKPTGVAVTAAAIHAALVSYGLIAP